MFLRGTEPLNEYEADATIEMEIGEDLEHSLARAIDGIVRELGLPRPDPERVGAALSKVRGYKPIDTTSPKKPKTKAKPAPCKRKTIYTDDHHQDKKSPSTPYTSQDRMGCFFASVSAANSLFMRQPGVVMFHAWECIIRLSRRPTTNFMATASK